MTGRVLYRFPGRESAFDSSLPVFSLVAKQKWLDGLDF